MSALNSLDRFGEEYLGFFKLKIVQKVFSKRMAFRNVWRRALNGMEGMDQKKCGQVILYKIYINCSECQNKNKKQFVYSTCSQHVLSLEFSCTELIIQ